MTQISPEHPRIASAIRMFSAWAEYRLAFTGNPGLSVAILSDQQVVWHGGFGYANIQRQEKASAENIYRVASITKLFTATAIMQLRDQGRLQLYDPVVNHIPWFNIGEAFPDEPPITVENLLTHTSGLPREPKFDHWVSSNFPDWEAIKSRLPRQKTVLPRHKKWKYSNLALALAGEIVAVVSGMSYFDYIEKNLLEPLGMETTFIRPVPPTDPRLAAGYGRRDTQGSRALSPYTDAQGLSAAFNLATTVLDMAKFIAFQFATDEASNRLLKLRSRQEMQRPHWVDPGWKAGWGLGFEIIRRWGKSYHGHFGAVQGFRTGVSFNIEEQIGAIAFTNSDDGDPAAYLLKLLSWFGPAIRAAREKPDLREQVPAEWNAYIGRYHNVWVDQQILAFRDKLVSINPGAPDPLASMVTLEPAGEHSFHLEQEQHGYGSHGEIVSFKIGSEGLAERILGASGEGEGAVRVVSW